MTFVLIVLAAVALLPYGLEVMRKQMNTAARSHAPGNFASLSQGVTHYQWTGPENGPVALCIHGLTTPSFVWKSTAQGLAEQGFRVLTYDLYGRGYSDRPRGVQDRAFFLQQLEDLLEDQGARDDLTVIGYSMGGMIATAYADRHPDSIRHLILLAPAGMKTSGFDLLRCISAMPVVGLWWMLAFFPRQLRKGLEAEAQLTTSVPDINARQKAELDWRGFVAAVQSSINGMLSDQFEMAHRALNAKGLPVMAIWGVDDDVIPIGAADLLSSWNLNAVSHRIEGAGHGLTYTHTAQVLDHIRDFTSDPH